MRARPPLVFISHAEEDRPFVELEVLPVLEDQDIPYWYSPRNLNPGVHYPQDITKAVQACPYFLVVASSKSVDAQWVKAEVHLAVESRREPAHLLVVSREACRLEDLHLHLLSLQRSDFAADPARARALLKAWVEAIAHAEKGLDDLVMTVIGARGGVGKSTIVCRLAEMIAETGHNALLVDLDTGTGGLSHLTAARARPRAACVSTREVMEAAAFGQTLARDLPRAQEVTPLYLSRYEGSGRVFLVPAMPAHGQLGRPMREILAAIEQSQGARGYADILDQILTEAAADVEVPLHCVLLDCGAEGEEFNAFVSAANLRSRLIYVVVQADEVCQKNVMWTRQHVARTGGAESSAKLRIIINRVFSDHHEPVARAGFATFDIAGCIFDDREYFSAIQRGHVNLESYDTISRGILAVLRHNGEVPPSMVPSDDDLWARRLARILSENNVGGVRRLFEQVMGRGAVFNFFIGLFVALLGLTGSVLGLARQLQAAFAGRLLGAVPMPLLWIGAVLALGIGIALIVHSSAKRRQLQRQLSLLNEIDRLIVSSPRPYKALLDHVRELARNPSDPRLVWLRTLGKALSADGQAA